MTVAGDLMIRRLRGPVMLVLLTLGACQAPNKEATVAGAQQVCSSCHGPGGRSFSPTFPRLAGQQKEYIETQLRAFRDKSRADPHAQTYMWGMAARLSDDTIAGLADYYSRQPAVAGSPGDPAEIAAGDKIFHDGIAAEGVPACIGCHGEKAEGAGPIPRLAGQQRRYIERQLDAFASQARANEIMHETSKNLTAQQISDVTAYLAAQ